MAMSNFEDPEICTFAGILLSKIDYKMMMPHNLKTLFFS